MASEKQSYLNLDNIEDVEVWLHIFEANARCKNLQDTEDNKNITDYFIASAGLSEIKKITTLCRPNTIQNMSYN